MRLQDVQLLAPFSMQKELSVTSRRDLPRRRPAPVHSIMGWRKLTRPEVEEFGRPPGAGAYSSATLELLEVGQLARCIHSYPVMALIRTNSAGSRGTNCRLIRMYVFAPLR